MIVVIMGEIYIKVVKMMIIEIVDQRVIFISETCIHEQRLAAARQKCAVSPGISVPEIDRCDLHVSAGCLCANGRGKGTENEENDQKCTDYVIPDSDAGVTVAVVCGQ